MPPEIDPAQTTETTSTVQTATTETPETALVTEGDGGSGAAAEEETVITLDGVENEGGTADEPAPQWVKDLRVTNRQQAQQIRDLQEAVKRSAPAAQAVVQGAEPQLSDDDIAYDQAKYKIKLTEWLEKGRTIADLQRKQQETVNNAQKAYETRLEVFGTQKKALNIRDFDELEATAKSILSPIQQGIIVNGADNAAAVVAALGKNPKKAAELAAISDPVKFTFAVAKLETLLKVTRKAAPLPENEVRGNASVVAGAVDSKLEQLRKEADISGDRTKVAQYMRQQTARKT